jgi:hypothetical protein
MMSKEMGDKYNYNYKHGYDKMKDDKIDKYIKKLVVLPI